MARPQKPCTPSWGGEPIVGLYRYGGSGRWRVNARGKKFTGRDERQAVARFLRWKSTQERSEALIPIPLDPIAPLESAAIPIRRCA